MAGGLAAMLPALAVRRRRRRTAGGRFGAQFSVPGGSVRIMSDLSIPLDARAKAQLPVHSYFEEGLFRKEQENIFELAPGYLGHELALPEVGDHLALVQEGEGRALVRSAPGPEGISLLSNVAGIDRPSCCVAAATARAAATSFARCTAGPTT
jgi:hypothetical protein